MKYKIVAFAKLLDVNRATVYTYVKRGKLLIENGLIDTDSPANKEFLDQRLMNVSGVGIVDTVNNISAVSDTKTLSQLRAEKLREEIVFARIRNAELEHKLVDVVVVNQHLSEVVRRYEVTVNQQADELIRDICNENEIDGVKRTTYLSKLTDITNEASRRAVVEAREAIEKAYKNE
jgi:hypothetical protein